MLVPARTVVDLVKVPQSIKPEWAAITGCGFGTAWNALTVKYNAKPSDTLLVVGAGGMGLSATAIATATGVKVIAIDINELSLDKARRIGAVRTYSYKNKDELNKISEDIVKNFGLIDAIFDTTGSPDTIIPLLPTLRPQGTLLLAGLMMKGKETLPLPADLIVAREIKIQGVLMLPSQKYDGIFKLMNEGRINLDPIIYKHISIFEVNEAYQEMSDYKNAGRFIINKFK
jgi:alcohol dehydrogenase